MGGSFRSIRIMCFTGTGGSGRSWRSCGCWRGRGGECVSEDDDGRRHMLEYRTPDFARPPVSTGQVLGGALFSIAAVVVGVPIVLMAHDSARRSGGGVAVPWIIL